MKKAVQKIMAVILTIGVCTIMMESGLRMMGVRPTNTTEGIAEQWDDSYRLKRNVSKDIHWPSFSYHIYTNAYGFRDARTGPRDLSEKPYYVFLGASDVFGNGVNYEDSFVGLFARQAAENGIEVLNLAVGGHSLLDQELLLKQFMNEAPRRPSKVFYRINELVIANFDRRNNGIVVKDGHMFDKKGWFKAYVRVKVGEFFSSYCYFRDRVRWLQMRWSKRVRTEKSLAFVQVYSKKNGLAKNRERIWELERHLDEFEQFCVKKGVDLVYFYLPVADSFRLNELLVECGESPDEYEADFYEKLLIEYCKRRNVQLINLRPVLKEHHDRGEQLRFQLDAHYNKLAHAVIGNYIVDQTFSRPATAR